MDVTAASDVGPIHSEPLILFPAYCEYSSGDIHVFSVWLPLICDPMNPFLLIQTPGCPTLLHPVLILLSGTVESHRIFLHSESFEKRFHTNTTLTRAENKQGSKQRPIKERWGAIVAKIAITVSIHLSIYLSQITYSLFNFDRHIRRDSFRHDNRDLVHVQLINMSTKTPYYTPRNFLYIYIYIYIRQFILKLYKSNKQKLPQDKDYIIKGKWHES